MNRLFATKFALSLSLLLGAGTATLAQPVSDGEGDVAIGALEVDPSALLDLVSTSKGFLLPRMTEAQRDAIASPAEALQIFNTTTGEFNYWDANTGQWEVFITSANISDFAWLIDGNDLTTDGAWNGVTGNFLGTTSAHDLVLATLQAQEIEFWTANTVRARFTAAGNFEPAVDNTYTLGTDATRWADAYVNGGSVHIGPGGGEAGGTEMDLGYAANTGTINVDGGGVEVTINAASDIITADADGDGVAELVIDAANNEVSIDPDGNGVPQITADAVTVDIDADNDGALEAQITGTTADLDVILDVDADDDGTTNLLVDGATVNVDADDDGNLEAQITGTTADLDVILDVDADDDGTTNLLVDGATVDVDADDDGTLEMQVSGTLVDVTTDLAVDADDDGTDNLNVSGAGVAIDGNDDGTTDVLVDAITGNTTVGDNIDEEQFRVDGVPTPPPGVVAAYDAVIDGDLDVQGTLGLTGYTDQSVLFIDNGGQISEDNPDFVYEPSTSTLAVGDGTSNTHLQINGVQDAAGPETLPNGVFDVAVEGDIAASGIIKSGAGVWLDGVSAPHSVTADQPLEIQTLGANDLMLATNNTDAVIIDGATQDVNILNNLDVDGNGNVDGTMNVVGATTLQSTLEVDGVTDLNSSLNVDGGADFNSTVNIDGATTINNSLTQLGGAQVTFSGNVDAQNGLDVSGDNLNVDPTVSIEATGANHTMGTLGTDAQVLEILGDNFNVGSYELIVDGDAQITGFLSLPGLGTNAVVYTDALGNLTTEPAQFGYDEVTDALVIGDGVTNSTLDLNGNQTINDIGAVDALVITESAAGDGIIINESGAGNALTITEANGGDGVNVTVMDGGQGLVIDQQGLTDGARIRITNPASTADALSLRTDGTGRALFVNDGLSEFDDDVLIDGVLTATNDGNSIGDGTAVTQLTINGVVDATGPETLPNPVFDLAVNGDIGASGIVKSGAGVWIDGVSPTHNLTADEPLDINTLAGDNLTLSTNSTVAVTVLGSNQNVGIGEASPSARLDVVHNNTGQSAGEFTGASSGFGQGGVGITVTAGSSDGILNGQTAAIVNGGFLTGIGNGGNGLSVSGGDADGIGNGGAAIVASGGDNLGIGDGGAGIIATGGTSTGIGGGGTGAVATGGAGTFFDPSGHGLVATPGANGGAGVGNAIVAQGTSDLQGAVSSSTGDVVVNDNLNVTGTVTGAAAGHSLGTLGTDATVLTVNGDDNNVGAYELVVNGDAQVTGVLSLPGLGSNAVVYTDAAGDLSAEPAQFGYDETTNAFTVGDGVTASSLDVNGTQTIDGIAAGNHLTITNFDAASTAVKINANGGIGVDIDPASTGIMIDATATGIDFVGSSPTVGIDVQATTTGVNITGATTSVNADNQINTATRYNVDGVPFLWDGPNDDNSNTFVGTTGNTTNTGNTNTFVGNNAGLANTSGFSNVIVGANAGEDNTIGSDNTFLGRVAGRDNVDGTQNTFLGTNAGRQNITGDQNVSVGAYSGTNLNSGNRNAYMGYDAGRDNTGGSNNTLIGSRSGLQTTGSGNAFLGYEAGLNNTTGTNNAALGTNAGPTAGGFTNTTAVGANAQVGQSNALVLGQVGVVDVGIGTSTPSARLDVVGSTELNGPLSQVGAGQVSFAGNVDINNGLDVLSGALNVTTTISNNGPGGSNLVIDDGAQMNGDLDLNTNDIIDLGDIQFNTAGSNISNALGVVTVNDGLDVNLTLNADGATTLNGNVTLGDSPTDVILINGGFNAGDQGNVIGDGADAQQLQVVGTVGGAVDVDVIGDVDIDGTLTVGTFSLGAANAGRVVVTDASGNLVTDPAFTYDVGTGALAADGSTTLGDDATADAVTVNGEATINEGLIGNGLTITESDAGDGLSITESGAGNAVTIVESNGGDGLNVTVLDGGQGLTIDQQGTTDGARIRITNPASTADALSLRTDGTGRALFVNDGAAEFDDIAIFDGGVAANDGEIDAASSIVPVVTNTFTLGNDANRWAEVYVEGASVHVGPAGGEGAGTELELGYAAGVGSVNVDGGVVEIDVAAAQTRINNAGPGGTLIGNSTNGQEIRLATVSGSRVAIQNDLNAGNVNIGNGLTSGYIDLEAGTASQVTINNGDNSGATFIGRPLTGGGPGSGSVLIEAGAGNVVEINTVPTGNATTTIGRSGSGITNLNSPTVNFGAQAGGGDQVLFVNNAGTVTASNAAPAQNALGIFAGTVNVAAPNAGGTEAVANTNVTAGSIITVTRVSAAGPQLSYYVTGVTAGVGFTVQFSGPVTAGDDINYTIINP